MRDARAEALELRLRKRHEVDECAEFDDLAGLLGWTDEQVEAAVDALVAAGRIELQATARGVLIWLVDETEEAAA